jgi:SAM-dependent methyltransferase
MPFRNNFFETIVSFETIEHLIRYERFLNEVKRVLMRRGYFIVSTPNKKLTSSRKGRQRNPFHAREFNAQEFSQLLSAFFTDFQLYGQHYCTVKDWLFGIVQRYLSSIPFPSWLKGLGRLDRTLRRPKDQKSPRRETPRSGTDPSYRVKEFRDFYPILTPAFLIGVTKK